MALTGTGTNPLTVSASAEASLIRTETVALGTPRTSTAVAYTTPPNSLLPGSAAPAAEDSTKTPPIRPLLASTQTGRMHMVTVAPGTLKTSTAAEVTTLTTSRLPKIAAPVVAVDQMMKSGGMTKSGSGMKTTVRTRKRTGGTTGTLTSMRTGTRKTQ